jgi:hypothetical protein
VALKGGSKVCFDKEAANSWPFKCLWERTSFGEEFHEEVMPRWGGFYLPEVRVRKDEFGGDIKPFLTSVVFGCASTLHLSGMLGSDEVDSITAFREAMRTKIRNLLRICHWHGHRELVIAARFMYMPVREVAALFREVLLESGDLVGVFRRVLFALPPEEVRAKVSLGFREEFHYAGNAGLTRASWREGRHLVPDGLRHLCFTAELDLAESRDLRGVEVKLREIVPRRQEHQLWRHLPCGRIVLAAFPQLCLSARQRFCGSDLHMWTKVDTNKHLQIWQAQEDGTIALEIDSDLRIGVSGNEVRDPAKLLSVANPALSSDQAMSMCRFQDEAQQSTQNR